MPSIQDVADQINARLDQIATSTADNVAVSSDIRSELIQTNGRLSQIDNTLTSGFQNLSQGLNALIQVQLAALELLDQNRQQNDTIICELANHSALLCNIMRKAGEQLRIGSQSLDAIRRIEGITERVHCCQATEYDRHHVLARQMEECCPTDLVPPEACPAICVAPSYHPRKPPGLDWKPLTAREQPPLR